MRTYEEAFEHALDKPPFSNGTEGYAWLDNWCYRCKNDGDHEAGGCPLVLVAFMDRTPSEWLEQPWGQIQGRPEGETAPRLGDTYHCIEFRDEDEDDGPGEPTPIPDPPGQLLLWPREPFEAVRMLVPLEVTRVHSVSPV